ncbi:MAG: hypothetical protein JSS27_05750 [Planctomycetes bacterium]|nr:hypothetical protein [Planctomycetota bacterium]
MRAVLGPIAEREIVAVPRRVSSYALRSAFLAALLLVTTTAWQMLTGTQLVRGVGELARFGAAVFQLLVPLQWLITSAYATVACVLAVAHEKERRTLSLLLLTRLSNLELVAGKLFSGLLNALVLWAVGVPFLALLTLLGGISFGQVARTELVSLASLLLCAGLGTMLAFWRERTLQPLALAAVAMLGWTLGWSWLMGDSASSLAAWGARVSPWHALWHAMLPDYAQTSLQPLGAYVGFCVVATAGVTLWAAWRVRAWNTNQEPRVAGADDESPAAAATGASNAPARSRSIGAAPILWRETRTWAYGRKVVLVRLAYLILFGLVFAAVRQVPALGGEAIVVQLTLALAPLAVISLLWINAQAVMSMTSERDGETIDLLLVTDLTGRELIVGKLLGTAYNAKEMITLPTLLVGYLAWQGQLRWETAACIWLGWLVLCVFAAVLGVHVASHHARSRTAIAVSLGTLFFLALGVAATMRIMVAFAGSFSFQLQPFLAAMVGGGIGIYWAISGRLQSPALLAASFFCPLATFYALASFLMGHTLAVLCSVVLAYGFAATAMLLPALEEFQLARGQSPEGSSQ